MNTRKNFIPRNEGFICGVCQTNVLPVRGTFRNHCTQCLTSKHVDDAIPGDRLSTCHGLMLVVGVAGTDPDKLDIRYQCQRCGKSAYNRSAPDDNREVIFRLLESTQ